ncbi:terminase small subunit [Candidatus Latescibacterota bacterium]
MSVTRDENGLTCKQRAFCEEYVKDFNGAQSAVRAGYAEKSANRAATRLLSLDHVQSYIDELLEEIADRNDVQVDEIVQELKRIGFAKIDEFTDLKGDELTLKQYEKLTPDQLACIAEISKHETNQGAVTVRFKLYDKMKALEMLGRYKGMFTERREVESRDTIIYRTEAVEKPANAGMDQRPEKLKLSLDNTEEQTGTH